MMIRIGALALALACAPTAALAQLETQARVHVEGQAVPRAVVQLIPADPENLPPGADSTVIDQSHLRFVPDILAVTAGTTVHFRNSDPIMHNVFSPHRRGADFDLGTYPIRRSRSYRFHEPGSYVILCHIHPEMSAWVVVVESPYFALTDDSGDFRIEDVPPGTYTLTTWANRREIPDQRVVVGAAGSE